MLLLGQGPELADWALPRKLTQDYGFAIGGLGFDQLTWEKLRQFNVVVLFDFNEAIARIYADAVKRGNPKAIVTFNPGVKLVRHTRAQDYTAGDRRDERVT